MNVAQVGGEAGHGGAPAGNGRKHSVDFPILPGDTWLIGAAVFGANVGG